MFHYDESETMTVCRALQGCGKLDAHTRPIGYKDSLIGFVYLCKKNLIEKYTRLTTLKLKFTRQIFFVFYPILYKHARILFLCHSTSKHLGVVASFTGLSRIPDFPKKGPIWEFGKTVAKGLYQSINKLDVFYGRLMAQ